MLPDFCGLKGFLAQGLRLSSGIYETQGMLGTLGHTIGTYLAASMLRGHGFRV